MKNKTHQELRKIGIKAILHTGDILLKDLSIWARIGKNQYKQVSKGQIKQKQNADLN